MCGCGEGACWATVLAVSVATASCKKNLERMCTGQARSKMRKRRTDARLQQRRGCSSGGGRRTAARRVGERQGVRQGSWALACGAVKVSPQAHSPVRGASPLARAREQTALCGGGGGRPADGAAAGCWLRAACTLAGAHRRVCDRRELLEQAAHRTLGSRACAGQASCSQLREGRQQRVCSTRGRWLAKNERVMEAISDCTSAGGRWMRRRGQGWNIALGGRVRPVAPPPPNSAGTRPTATKPR